MAVIDYDKTEPTTTFGQKGRKSTFGSGANTTDDVSQVKLPSAMTPEEYEEFCMNKERVRKALASFTFGNAHPGKLVVGLFLFVLGWALCVVHESFGNLSIPVTIIGVAILVCGVVYLLFNINKENLKIAGKLAQELEAEYGKEYAEQVMESVRHDSELMAAKRADDDRRHNRDDSGNSFVIRL